ncbi:collagen-like protein 7 [Powai lake megavirus]|uniref:Collagen-like protein 7 n=1 Tax=Powai lake megavirus TaxID=1842663 RepID=A0A167R838_9VIRU|nr:collagen-like protein 7 [Powai lake megavirus]ANB50407.1 collagen-like protein 7 [Powai lake megavirus]
MTTQPNGSSDIGPDPFDPSNTSGLNMKYFGLSGGAFRAGNFTANNLSAIGQNSVAFGYQTQAPADGSIAYGLNLSGNISAYGIASIAGGQTINNGSIFTGSGSIGSYVNGLVDNSIISIGLGAIGSKISGNVINGNMTTGSGAHGSIITGYTSSGNMTIGTRAYGSLIRGSCTNNTLSIGDGSIGSSITASSTSGLITIADNVHGASICGTNNTSIISIGNSSYGSSICGYAFQSRSIIENDCRGCSIRGTTGSSSLSTIKFASDGSCINGSLTSSGLFSIETNSIASEITGSCTNGTMIISGRGSKCYGTCGGSLMSITGNACTIQGSSVNSSVMTISTGSLGSRIMGRADNGSMIIGDGSLGSMINGYSSGGGIISSSGNGTFIAGLASASGEIHQVTSNGSFSLGRNNKVNNEYSGAIGINSLAYMPGSISQASFSSSGNLLQSGSQQSTKVLGRNLSGRIVLADGSFATLPYTGFANIKAKIIGSSGTIAGLCFQVSNIGGNYGVFLPTTPSGGLVCYGNPVGVVPSPIFVPTALSTSGFTVAINVNTDQNYTCYYNIVNISS